MKRLYSKWERQRCFAICMCRFVVWYWWILKLKYQSTSFSAHLSSPLLLLLLSRIQFYAIFCSYFSFDLCIQFPICNMIIHLMHGWRKWIMLHKAAHACETTHTKLVDGREVFFSNRDDFIFCNLSLKSLTHTHNTIGSRYETKTKFKRKRPHISILQMGNCVIAIFSELGEWDDVMWFVRKIGVILQQKNRDKVAIYVVGCWYGGRKSRLTDSGGDFVT